MGTVLGAALFVLVALLVVLFPALTSSISDAILFFPKKLGLVPASASGTSVEIDAPVESSIHAFQRGRYLVYSAAERTPACDIVLISEDGERIAAQITVDYGVDDWGYLGLFPAGRAGAPIYEFRLRDAGEYRVSITYWNPQIQAGTRFRFLLDTSSDGVVVLLLSALTQGAILAALAWGVWFLLNRKRLRAAAQVKTESRERWEAWYEDRGE
jgi:hypothetical protein